MKLPFTILGVLLAAGVASAAAEYKPAPPRKPAASSARDAAKPSKQTKPAKVEAKGETQVYTGSYLPRKLEVHGLVTDGPHQLIVLDSEAIRRSGRSSLNQVLGVYGLRR